MSLPRLAKAWMAGLGATTALAVVPLVSTAARAAGDPGRGERVFQYCYSCHSVDPSETTALQGPSLVGIVGRRIAAQESFEYSAAMRAFAAEHESWEEELLDRYIAAPLRLVPKTTMAFPGVEDAQERADLLAFLRKSSDR